MKFTRRKGLILVSVVALAWGGFWLVENFEMKEIRYPSSLQGEAVRNNLLAAERLATAMGAQATSGFGVHRLPAGPPDRAVLVMPTSRRTLSPRQRDELLRWIEAGGHLIAVTYTLEDDGDAPDPLLSAFGIRQFLSEEGKKSVLPKVDINDDDLDEDTRAARKKSAQEARDRRNLERNAITRNIMAKNRSCPTVRESGSLAPLFPVRDKLLAVCFDTWFRLESRDPPLWAVASKQGVHALSVAHGKGKVTVLTDYDYMTNERIRNADHAFFVATLLGFTGHAADRREPTALLFVPREDVPGILKLTWRYAWPVILSLAALLAFGLWRAAMRLGPLVPARSMARRSLAEHVHASGEFLWRHGAMIQLWRATLARTQRQIDRVLPAAGFASTNRQLDALAMRSGLDPKRIEEALDSKAPPPAEQFPTIIATLELLRKKL